MRFKLAKDSELHESFDNIANIYDETRAIPDTILKEFYEKLIKKGINFNNSIILDGGIGTGRTILPLLVYDIDLLGLDKSIEMLNILKNKYSVSENKKKITLIVGDISYIPFKESSFDIVILIQLLHLVKNRKEVINEVMRVLKPNGFLVIGGLTSPALASKVYKKYISLSSKYRIGEKFKNTILNILYLFNKSRYTRNIVKPFLEIYDPEFYINSLATSMEKDEIVLTEDINTYDVFKRLNNRYHTFQWDIPIKKHKKIMLNLKKWIDDKENHVTAQEKISRHFSIIIAHFGEIHENK